MATVYAILTFASDTIQKKSSLAEILPSTIETIMSILQKEFLGGNVYFPLLRVKEFKRKRLPPPTAQWFKNLRPDFFI